MELCDIASRIVFSNSLEEKLTCPDDITDEKPSGIPRSPESPGRPSFLTFKPASRRSSEFPNLSQLEKDHERGRLLHFFANHELLAVELMALVLLRFPEAPNAFRRGVLQTLRDEQRHVRWYLARMKTCGVGFGSHPVSGFFWRQVSGMESPMEFVSRLSLTFEQANLDYCRHFSGLLQTVGDTPSAQIMDQIYRDEIGHVAHGLKWFRKWKQPDESDWDAFCRELKFPLSPSRARGIGFNAAGRLAAGLEPGFISQLSTHQQSRGRTPHVYVANFFAEGEWALGKAFTPRRLQQALGRDLASLPWCLARQDDIVLCPTLPSIEHRQSLGVAGIVLPEFLEAHPGRLPDSHPLRERKLCTARPWAWTPTLQASLADLPWTSPSAAMPTPDALEHWRPIFGKAWGVQWMQSLLPNLETAEWLASPQVYGCVVRSLAEALDTIRSIRDGGHHRIVVKKSLGLAGQNALRLWEPEILPAQQRWLEEALESDPACIVEPWLERSVDFSIHADVKGVSENRPLQPTGYVVLEVDRRGQYSGNQAGPGDVRRIPDEVLREFPGLRDARRRIQGWYESFLKHLQLSLQGLQYTGPVGIDAFVYRDASGQPRIKPFVELNPRFTMGRVTLELMRFVAPGSRGRFSILSRKSLRETGDTFSQFADRRRLAQPVVTSGNPVPRIQSGWLALNDPAAATEYLATWEVSRSGGPTAGVHLPPEPEDANLNG